MAYSHCMDQERGMGPDLEGGPMGFNTLCKTVYIALKQG